MERWPLSRASYHTFVTTLTVLLHNHPKSNELYISMFILGTFWIERNGAVDVNSSNLSDRRKTAHLYRMVNGNTSLLTCNMCLILVSRAIPLYLLSLGMTNDTYYNNPVSIHFCTLFISTTATRRWVLSIHCSSNRIWTSQEIPSHPWTA